MSAFAREEFLRVINGEPLLGSITLDMLKTLA